MIMDILDRLKGMTDGTPNNEVMGMAKDEIQTLRAKVASAEVLVEAMSDIAYGMQTKANNNTVIKDTTVSRFADEIFKALATYDKLSEVKHDTK